MTDLLLTYTARRTDFHNALRRLVAVNAAIPASSVLPKGLAPGKSDRDTATRDAQRRFAVANVSRRAARSVVGDKLKRKLDEQYREDSQDLRAAEAGSADVQIGLEAAALDTFGAVQDCCAWETEFGAAAGPPVPPLPVLKKQYARAKERLTKANQLVAKYVRLLRSAPRFKSGPLKGKYKDPLAVGKVKIEYRMALDGRRIVRTKMSMLKALIAREVARSAKSKPPKVAPKTKPVIALSAAVIARNKALREAAIKKREGMLSRPPGRGYVPERKPLPHQVPKPTAPTAPEGSTTPAADALADKGAEVAQGAAAVETKQVELATAVEDAQTTQEIADSLPPGPEQDNAQSEADMLRQQVAELEGQLGSLSTEMQELMSATEASMQELGPQVIIEEEETLAMEGPLDAEYEMELAEAAEFISDEDLGGGDTISGCFGALDYSAVGVSEDLGYGGAEDIGYRGAEDLGYRGVVRYRGIFGADEAAAAPAAATTAAPAAGTGGAWDFASNLVQGGFNLAGGLVNAVSKATQPRKKPGKKKGGGSAAAADVPAYVPPPAEPAKSSAMPYLIAGGAVAAAGIGFLVWNSTRSASAASRYTGTANLDDGRVMEMEFSGADPGYDLDED